MAFQVHIADENLHAQRALRSFASYPQAKAYAELRADEFHFGTIILDTIRDIICTGNGFYAVEDAEMETRLPAPFYARRMGVK